MEGKKQIRVAVVTERPGMCNTEYYYIDAADGERLREAWSGSLRLDKRVGAVSPTVIEPI